MRLSPFPCGRLMSFFSLTCSRTPDQYFGRSGLRKNYAVQIGNILEASYRQMGEVPVVLGETGCPFDLNGGPEAVQVRRNGEWRGSDQERMVDSILGAIGEAGLSNYK